MEVKELLEKYPFLFINSGVYPWLDGSTKVTWLNCMPDGWRIAFGQQLIDELLEWINKYDIKNYHVEQVKEKFGSLCWYDSYDVNEDASKEHGNILRKYVELSSKTCVGCGNVATVMSKGWICPYCDDCYSKIKHYKL